MDEIKNIARIDRIVLAGSILVVFIIAFVLAQNMLAGSSNLDRELFSFKSGSVILIDENLNFRSPERVEAKDNLVINLGKGIYYWKIEDAIPAEDIVQLDIKDSAASLKLRKSGEGYEVVNSGNSTLNVDVYSSGKFTGRVILGGGDAGAVSDVVTIGGEGE